MNSLWKILVAVVWLLSAFTLVAQDNPPKLPEPPQVKEISPGIFQVGTVRLDKNKEALSFRAHFHITEGLIEYLIVTTAGKLHESMLRTEAQPQHIQVAMLLLGAKGASAKELQRLFDDPKLPIPGQPVEIELRWKSAEKEKSLHIAELVLDKKSKGPMTKGAFVFNGSRVFEGTFIAQRDGSIVSLITDVDAQFNNPRPGREDDENFTIAIDNAPPKDTVVEVIIRLVKPSVKPAEKKPEAK